MEATQLHTDILDGLKLAYGMKAESAINLMAASVNLDGLRASTLRGMLKSESEIELHQSSKLASRIKVLGGSVPGSMQMEYKQRYLQPSPDSADIVSIIRGVIRAKEAAIIHYRRMVDLTDGSDLATAALMTELLATEEERRREYAGFLLALQHDIPPHEVPNADVVMPQTVSHSFSNNKL